MDVEKSCKGKGGARPGAGRKPFQPTDEERKQVKDMASVGVPLEQIAAVIRDGIDFATLKKHFNREIKLGKAEANEKVGKSLFQKIMDGDTTAAIWWTKTQMGWKSAERHEITGADGGPVSFTEVVRKIVKSGD